MRPTWHCDSQQQWPLDHVSAIATSEFEVCLRVKFYTCYWRSTTCILGCLCCFPSSFLSTNFAFNRFNRFAEWYYLAIISYCLQGTGPFLCAAKKMMIWRDSVNVLEMPRPLILIPVMITPNARLVIFVTKLSALEIIWNVILAMGFSTLCVST